MKILKILRVLCVLCGLIKSIVSRRILPNLSEKLEARFSGVLLSHLRRMAEVCERHDVELYLVGGAVRDALLDMPNGDVDVSLVGAGEDFDAVLAHELRGEIQSRSEFGTSKLVLHEATIDLVNARKESYKNPGALPTVEPGSIEDDLGRRDFSINAMAVVLAASSGHWGDLLDPHNGLEDLERGAIRILHDASFVDDATRILRGVRYVGRLGFAFADDTLAALRRDLSYLDTIKGARVRHEFERIFAETQVLEIMRLARDVGVLSAVYRPLAPTDLALSRFADPASIQPAGRELIFISLLSHSMSVTDGEGFIRRLDMNAEWARAVRDTIAVKALTDSLSAPDLSNSQIYHMLSDFDQNAIKSCALASDNRTFSERLELYLNQLRYVHPVLDGDDIMRMGVSQGPQVGSLLRLLLDAKLDSLVSTRQDEEELVRRRMR